MSTNDFLDKIHRITKKRVAERKFLISSSSLEARALEIPVRPRVFETLFDSGTFPRIIAEVKKQSPSVGELNREVIVPELAGKYFSAGACAVSILTEPEYFLGSLEELSAVRLTHPDLPILQKDFVTDPYQIFEAKIAGADCILLIVAMLSREQLASLNELAKSLGLSVLVEVHTEQELRVAVNLGAKIIGVNNRDLSTLSISLDVSRRLATLIPENVIAISESGITSSEVLKEFSELGYDGFLLGSSLMREKSPDGMLRSLMEGIR